MPETIVAGNWKMNMTLPEAESFLMDLKANLPQDATRQVRVITLPPFPLLAPMADQIRGTGIHVGAQNCHQANSGAYTGEVSAPMLTSVGAEYVIIGHSERRQYFEEGGSLIGHKIDMAMHYGLTPIYCCGETQEQRDNGHSEKVVQEQIKEELCHLDKAELKQVVIGYEPVWAIGTGKNATPEDAEAMHKAIRRYITKQYDDTTAEEIPIIYGGSVKPGNARDLFSRPNINGGLIGGASLNPDNFIEIIKGAI